MLQSPVRRLFAAILGVVLLAAVGINLAEARRNATFPPDSPQGMVQAYLKAIGSDQWDRAFSYVAQESACTRQDMDAAFGAPIERTIIQSTRITGDRGTVLVRMEMGYSSPFGGQASVDETFTVVREGDQWRLTGRIWPMETCR